MAYSPQPFLGVACLALTAGFASAWTGDGSGTSGFVVDQTQRNDVLAFYHAVYQTSEGFEGRMNWTGGNYSSPYAEGTTSAAFVNDVERRVNYYRAMAGIPANAQFNTGSKVIIGADAYTPAVTTAKAAASQRSALMLAVNHNSSTGANPAFTHTPPNSCAAWTTAAWNGNYRGNLAIGTYGPRSVDVYFKEDAANKQAGHRRWLLLLRGKDYATGDTPGSGSGTTSIPSTNNLYVIHRSEEYDTTVPAQFVPYPGAGFFPASLNTDYWSLGYPNAGFASATVTMTPQGGSPVNIPSGDISRATGYGENAIVWKVPAAAAVTNLDNDLTYQVTVSNITGITGITSYTYSVTLINPNRMLSPLTLTGAASSPVAGANYAFTPVPNAEQVEFASFKASAVAWSEAAEASPVPRVINRTSSNYAFLSNVGQYTTGFPSAFFVGSRAFRLTFGSLPVRDEMFEVDRDIVPVAAPKLLFSYRKGYMTPNTSLLVEQSNNGGATWTNLRTIVGATNADAGFANDTVDLTAGTQPIRVRFRLTASGTASVYTHAYTPADATGIFIDSISTSGCQWLDKSGSATLTGAVSQATFNASVAGSALVAGAQYHLRLRAKLGGVWFYYGLPKVVTVTAAPMTGYQAWTEYEYPTLVGQAFDADSDGDGIPNGVEFAFSLDPRVRQNWVDIPVRDELTGRLKITRPLPTVRTGITYGAEWSDNLATWATANVIITTTGGQAVASVPMVGGSRYLRWKITTP